MNYQIPKLNYAYDALEPYLDAKTMELHHTKHHQAYTDKLNAVLEKYPDYQSQPVDVLLKNIAALKMEESDRTLLKNHGGGYVNHNLFWEVMGPKKEVDEGLVELIIKDFGSVEDFKTKFNQAAGAHFGSGWAWLAKDNNNKLLVYSLPNQDSPLSLGHQPIITLDLWEHAYYLKYQNRRLEYIKNWWNVLKIL